MTRNELFNVGRESGLETGFLDALRPLVEAAAPGAREHLRPAGSQALPLIEIVSPGPFRIMQTTRLGGLSKAGYASLNLSYWVGDHEPTVRLNHRRLAEALGTELERLVLPWQVHSTEVLELDECDRRGTFVQSDGVVLRTGRDQGRAALMLSGDCLTLALVGEETCVLIHAGWRGLRDGIVQRGVQAMGDDVPRWVFMGPAIGPCCYEVRKDVAEPMRRRFGADVITSGGCLDLWRCAEVALEEVQLVEATIVNPRLCTACHSELFYSHRKEGPATGRHTIVAWSTR